MADLDDVRRIARSLPGSVEGTDRFGFGVENKGKVKGFCWSWKERVDPRRARVENLDVLAVRVSGAEEKQQLLDADRGTFFTEPHYNGYPAVLVRLAEVDVDELRELLTDAWWCMAPKDLREQLDRRRRGIAAPVGSQASRMSVQGPSFTSETRMCAPNAPVCTRAPSSRSTAQNSSTTGSATGPGAAADQPGRRPLLVSAYRVNWLTTSTGAPRSEAEVSSARMRSPQIFVASRRACSAPSPCVTPSRTSRPGSLDAADDLSVHRDGRAVDDLHDRSHAGHRAVRHRVAVVPYRPGVGIRRMMAACPGAGGVSQPRCGRSATCCCTWPSSARRATTSRGGTSGLLWVASALAAAAPSTRRTAPVPRQPPRCCTASERCSACSRSALLLLPAVVACLLGMRPARQQPADAA